MIKGKKVTLRAIEESDLDLLHEWSNDESISSMLGGWNFPSSKKDQRKWFDSLNLKSNSQRFAIDAPDVGLIGTANLVDINWKDRNGFHGMLLGKEDIRGKGYGVDTIMSIMRYAFEELGLNRLDGSMIEYNKTSIAVYTKACGWKIEGTQRSWYFRKNRFWDKVVVGVTKEDYFQLIDSNNYWVEE